MTAFKIGGKVVCVEPIYNLKKDRDYEIKGIFDFGCGNILLDVGVENGTNKNYVSCRCGKTHYVGSVYSNSRFRKLDYDFAENLLADIKEAVQSEYQLN